MKPLPLQSFCVWFRSRISDLVSMNHIYVKINSAGLPPRQLESRRPDGKEELIKQAAFGKETPMTEITTDRRRLPDRNSLFEPKVINLKRKKKDTGVLRGDTTYSHTTQSKEHRGGSL